MRLIRLSPPTWMALNFMLALRRGREGGRLVHRLAVSAFPDFHATIEDLIAEGDKVAARMIFRGTHTGGEFMGIPPSGRSFAFSATAIFRALADASRGAAGRSGWRSPGAGVAGDVR